MSKKNFFITLIFGLFLSGCGGSSDEPTQKDLITALKFKLPSYISVNDLQIDVSENIGSKVEPVVRSRFKGKLTLTEDLYINEKLILNKKVLKKISEKKSEINLFGISNSVFKMDKWKVSFDKVEMLPMPEGKPMSAFLKGSFVISGSNEENQLIKEKKEKEEADKRLELETLNLLTGQWKGEYICGQGTTGIKLDIKTISNILAVTLDFFPLKSNPKAKKGSYTLSGRVNKKREFIFAPKSWIDRPSGYSMVGLKGLVDKQGKVIKGRISHSGCSTFEMAKILKIGTEKLNKNNHIDLEK